MPTPRKDTQEAEALKLLKKKFSAAHTAKKIGVHPSTVQRWAKRHGITLPYPYNRHEHREDLVDTQEIIRLRKRKNVKTNKPLFTLQEIGDLCGCSKSYVKQICARARKDGSL